MKNLFIAGAIALGLAAPASAALYEFDVTSVYFYSPITTDIYNPTGTTAGAPAVFTIDTDTGAVSDVDIYTPFDTYVTGALSGGTVAFVGYDYSGLGFDISDILADLAASPLAVGALEYFYPTGTEVQGVPFGSPTPTSFTVVGEVVDPFGVVTRLPDPVTTPDPSPSAVPLPAGMPLLLGAFGLLGLARRKTS